MTSAKGEVELLGVLSKTEIQQIFWYDDSLNGISPQHCRSSNQSGQ